ncbi:type II toxin-antitoxin system RelE/ParE family toxin [Caulobacter hibisci]|uniref:Type II toxin-antitoxin system RelE/ParE family toxin n=1 Tax=Caulobacter hibisci TaxID=2035993 RepID=A0ABS0SYV4_9CAUL|nr:type II toxin-antitoxin system RelE/ParE family toxin [Caulobacter hibisci]
MRRIVFTEPANTDVNRLEAWLIERGLPYARGLGLELEAAINGLIDFPERSSANRTGRYREHYVVFHSNQYVIQYQVHGDAIVILRIRHSLEDR